MKFRQIETDGYEYQHPIMWDNGEMSEERHYFMGRFEKQSYNTIKKLGREIIGINCLTYRLNNDILLSLYI